MRTRPRRETTALQRKLEAMAQQIGNFGLGAALFALAAMAGQFSWATFFVAGRAWDPAFLTAYLKFVITAITILVRLGGPVEGHTLGEPTGGNFPMSPLLATSFMAGAALGPGLPDHELILSPSPSW